MSLLVLYLFEDGSCYVLVLDGAPARIYMWTSQRLAETGHDAQLYCRASGSPQPTVTWYDPDEREISPHDKKYTVSLGCLYSAG